MCNLTWNISKSFWFLLNLIISTSIIEFINMKLLLHHSLNLDLKISIRCMRCLALWVHRKLQKEMEVIL